MKALFHKIWSTSIALAVLFSTLSFSVDSHYCGATLVDTSVFGKAETCGMEMSEPTDWDGCAIDKKNCCTDVIVSIKGQNELQQVSLNNSTFVQQVFIPAFVFSFVLNIQTVDSKTLSFKEYPPPLLVQDIQLLDEVFLI